MDASSDRRLDTDDARRVVRNSALQSGADAVSKLAMLAFFGVLARELGADGLGAFTFGVSVVVFIEVAGIAVDITVASDVARDRRRASIVLAESMVAKAVASVAGVAVVAGVALASGLRTEVAIMLVGIVAAKGLEMAMLGMHAVFRGLEDALPIAKGLILQRLTMAAGGSAVLVLFDGGLVAVAATLLVSMALGLAFTARWLAPVVALRIARPPLSDGVRLLRRSVPIGVGSIFGALLARVDIVILQLMTDAATVGAYGGAYRLLEGVQFVPYAFGLALLPVLSRLGADAREERIAVVELGVKAIAAVLAPIGLALGLFADPIVRAFLGDGLSEAIAPTRWLGVAVVPFGVFIVCVYVLVATDRQRPIPALMAAAAGMNIGLVLALVPSSGAEGAAIAMAATQVALTGAFLFAAARALGGFSLARALGSTAAASLAMATVSTAFQESSAGLLISLATFAIVVFATEALFFRRDLELVRRVLARRPTETTG